MSRTIDGQRFGEPEDATRAASRRGTLFTDGSCLGNPGFGGWAFLLQTENGQVTQAGYHGSKFLTTNNRMELTAVIEGLREARRLAIEEVEVVTDSMYLVNQQSGAKNKDLWDELRGLLVEFDKVTWSWVPGHSGHSENERVDYLARRAAETGRTKKKAGRLLCLM